MYTDREAMKRQSSVLLATAQSDVRLMEALLQIEQLTTELEAVKQENKGKVKRRILSSPYTLHTYFASVTRRVDLFVKRKAGVRGATAPITGVRQWIKKYRGHWVIFPIWCQYVEFPSLL